MPTVRRGDLKLFRSDFEFEGILVCFFCRALILDEVAIFRYSFFFLSLFFLGCGCIQTVLWTMDLVELCPRLWTFQSIRLCGLAPFLLLNSLSKRDFQI
jgi:hypothetical protein